MTSMRMHPPPAGEIREIHGDVVFPASHPEDPSLPYVAINMVSSLDGKASTGGKSGPIGGPVDRGVMRILRSKADAVMVGAGTLRAEKASLTTEGRSSPEPFAILASASLDFPLGNLLHAGSERTIILTSARRVAGPATKEEEWRAERIESLKRGMSVVEGGIADALRKIKLGHGIGSILLEGGPTLNHSLIRRGLVSEVFLTLSPKLLGGDPGGVVEGPGLEGAPEAGLVSISAAKTSKGTGVCGELFLRYKMRPPGLP